MILVVDNNCYEMQYDIVNLVHWNNCLTATG